ncbi:hypothetical protein BZJ19_11560, partial [Salinivibrio proteolyticus]|uniref:hypothetical protein n=1 Tax=Salinivibrio proteolyticus TaxID=334715 RepID=UPI0009D404B1
MKKRRARKSRVKKKLNRSSLEDTVGIKELLEASFRYTTNIIMIVFISAIGKAIYNCEGFTFYTVATLLIVFILIVSNVIWYIVYYVKSL